MYTDLFTGVNDASARSVFIYFTSCPLLIKRSRDCLSWEGSSHFTSRVGVAPGSGGEGRSGQGALQTLVAHMVNLIV